MLLCSDEIIVNTTQTDSIAARTIDKSDHLLIHRTGKGHHDRLQYRFIRIALTADKPRLNAELCIQVGHGIATTMHDDDVNADLLEQRHILGERLFQYVLGHRCTAILDHEGLPFVTLDVW